MTEPNAALRRQVGVLGATMMGLGSIIGTGIFVSIGGIAAGAAGPSVVLAIVVAALVATCNALSSAQLAANHPVSGGTYECGYCLLGGAAFEKPDNSHRTRLTAGIFQEPSSTASLGQ
jgi:APA family basic amino acid/polyamine antiporter